MRARLVTGWSHLRSSYWFLPSLMAVLAVVMSFVTTACDLALGSQWMEDISWLYANKPDGARAVLSTVAGSMITVAGVTFSMTILSISHTTSQIGPRLLNNFMRDTRNQFTLGIFVSTFLYCLLVLRTVRNGGSIDINAGGHMQEAAAFVPHIAVLVALLLAITSVGVLIFFVHHIPESIHISNIVANVGRELNTKIEDQFPSHLGLPHEDESERDPQAALPETFYTNACKLTGVKAGYVEYVDTEGLIAIATEHDLVIRLRCRAGDFVTPQTELLLVAPASRIDEQITTQLLATFATGSQRTSNQNLRFLVNQLVEVAMRALSPGVNDPFTAMNCMDWLQSGLESLANRKLPDAHRHDDNHNLRIVTEPDTFATFVSLISDQLRPYAAADRNAAIHMMEMLAKVAAVTEHAERRRVLIISGSRLRKECLKALSDKSALRMLTDRYRSLIRLGRDAAYREQLMESGHWIGGRA
ncbi:MAG: DUF2254 domain-containing protein [Planctomycetaceae bacterium]|nr:DUF2254 domain-containing protein [Planctomycetaceae bacterium]